MSSHEKEYSRYLSTLDGIPGSLIDRLKIKYRPYICPFSYIIEKASGHSCIYDVGCGYGQLLFVLDRFASSVFQKMKGIEISDILVGQAKEILHKNKFRSLINIEKYIGTYIPDDIKDYDLILMIDVLHHIPKEMQKDILNQIYRKARPGAWFLLKDINAASSLVHFNKLHDLLLSKETGNEISFSMAKTWLTSFGFILRESFEHTTWWYPHYFILVEKPF